MSEMKTKPKASSGSAQNEIDKAAQQFDAFEENVKELTMDRMNKAPKYDVEPQTQMSQKEIDKSKEVYLKPKRAIACKEAFNEKFREAYNFDKEYVQFIAENKEIIGESIDIWTKPYAGVPAQEWEVPVNKPIWGPRFLAEQIKRKYYHRLKTVDAQTTASDNMSFYGTMVADTTVQRLDAVPVNQRKSVFMGASGF